MIDLIEQIKTLKAEHVILQEQYKESLEESKDLSDEIIYADEARTLIQKAAKITEERLEIHFGTIVSKALEAVFNDPYEFVPEFVERRGKIECDLWFSRNGHKIIPKLASGGGAVDIASFALRMAYLKMETTAPLLILDEPFKMLSSDLMPYAAKMLKFMSDDPDMNFQIIMNTHSPALTDCADKLFRIERGEVS